MATRPATAPEAAPSVVAWPSRIFSTTIQASAAAAVATWVLMNAAAASPLAPSAEPALKPNQPNHSRTGAEQHERQVVRPHRVLGQPRRLPRTSASASAAAPALMCTAVPPAKSRAWSRSAIQPPSPSSKEKTQCATGK